MLFRLCVWLLSYSVICEAKRTSFVLVGATGDLARKYLWEALFVGFVEGVFEEDVKIYGAATRPAEEGSAVINKYLSSLHCKDTWSSEQCNDGITRFQSLVEYIQLKTEQDFQSLGGKLDASNDETLRIFYLSVSPSLYESLATSIHRHARPSSGTELRVVFEKPFGRDLSSAEELSQRITHHLSEDEIFRVDHYLGKEGMKAIVDFRKRNRDILRSINMPTASSFAASRPELHPSDDNNKAATTASVSVIMKEVDDTAGRSSYYDQYGVIRDVFQNHLTQALVYSLMHIDSEETETFGSLSDRLSLLNSLEYQNVYTNDGLMCILQSKESNLWLGQYQQYHEHLVEDHITELTRKNNHEVSLSPSERRKVEQSITPTAAAVRLQASLPGTRDQAEVTIAGGKALDTREMVVEVTTSYRDTDCSMVFGVQGRPSSRMSISGTVLGEASGPYLLLKGRCWGDVQETAARIEPPLGWVADPGACVESIRSRISDNVTLLAEPHPGADSAAQAPVECLLRPKRFSDPVQQGSNDSDLSNSEVSKSSKHLNNAYIQVLKALIAKDRSYFTTTQELHSQWRIWEPVLLDADCASGFINKYEKGSASLLV